MNKFIQFFYQKTLTSVISRSYKAKNDISLVSVLKDPKNYTIQNIKALLDATYSICANSDIVDFSLAKNEQVIYMNLRNLDSVIQKLKANDLCFLARNLGNMKYFDCKIWALIEKSVMGRPVKEFNPANISNFVLGYSKTRRHTKIVWNHLDKAVLSRPAQKVFDPNYAAIILSGFLNELKGTKEVLDLLFKHLSSDITRIKPKSICRLMYSIKNWASIDTEILYKLIHIAIQHKNLSNGHNFTSILLVSIKFNLDEDTVRKSEDILKEKFCEMNLYNFAVVLKAYVNRFEIFGTCDRRYRFLADARDYLEENIAGMMANNFLKKVDNFLLIVAWALEKTGLDRDSEIYRILAERVHSLTDINTEDFHMIEAVKSTLDKLNIPYTSISK